MGEQREDKSAFWEDRALKDRFLRFWPAPVLENGRSRIKEVIDRTGSGGLILNLGSGRRELEDWNNYRMVNLDIQRFPLVHLVGDAHKLPLADAGFDTVICAAVLEHTRRPWIIADEIFRVLRPGGLVFIGVPFLQPFHASPSDYYRFTQMGLQELMGGFEEIESGVLAGPASAVTFIMMYFAGTLVNNYYVSNALKFAVGWLLSPLKYLDKILASKKYAHSVASGVYFVGRKPSVCQKAE